MDTLTGTAQRFVHRSDDMKFGVLEVESNGSSVKVVGGVCNAIEGLGVIAKGSWFDHPAHGRQFQAASLETEEPVSKNGVITYLSSDLIEGVGPKNAANIYEYFGEDTLRVIKEEPERLTEVPGIGKKRAERLSDSVKHQVVVEKIAVWLFDKGISENVALAIYSQYGLQSISRLTENPYILAEEFVGLGFRTADEVALKIGVARDAPERIRAAILHVMSRFESRGNTACPQYVLESECHRLIGRQELAKELATLEEKKRVLPFIKNGITTYQRPRMRLYEHRIAQTLGKRNTVGGVEVSDHMVDLAEQDAEITLDVYQRPAARGVCEGGFSVLIGKPGTGKTSTLKVILSIFDQANAAVLLAAPTGKAARRMAEATGREAQTVHRVLGSDPSSPGFAHNSENYLPCDILVIDEASMLDTWLMYSVCEALSPRTQLVLVGDENQLPSVGPGRVLSDIIESRVASVYELEKIHRQAARSAIITRSHAVIEGKAEELTSGSDLRLIDYPDAGRLANKLADFILDQFAPKLGVDDVVNDIQILTGVHKGPLGTLNLNAMLARRLNPDPPYTQEYKKIEYGVGDKVIVTRNNYDLDVFNGTLGQVAGTCKDIDKNGRVVDGLIVTLEDGSTVRFIGSQRDDISPAWALTVHKTQGSEFPFVIMIVHNSQGMMLERNWLYTGMTRAKEYCVMIGDPEARNRAVVTVRSNRRVTLLKDRLTSASTQ